VHPQAEEESDFFEEIGEVWAAAEVI